MKFNDLIFLIDNAEGIENIEGSEGSENLINAIRSHRGYTDESVPEFLKWFKLQYDMLGGTPDDKLYELAKDTIDYNEEEDWTEESEIQPEDYYNDVGEDLYDTFLKDYIAQGLRAFKYKRQLRQK